MATVAAAPRRDIKVIGLIGFGHMMSHFYFLIFPPILPLLKTELGISYAALGLVISVYGLAAAVAQTPVGFLVDRFGGRPALVCGVLIQAGAITLIGLTTDYWQMLLLYAVAGVANTVYHPADYAILSASIPKQRLGRAYSIHLFTGNFGWAITPAVMVGLTATWGWRAAFVIVGAVGIAFALFAWTQSRLLDDDIERRRQRLRERQDKARRGGWRDELAEGMRLLMSLPIVMCFLFFIMMSLGFTGVRSFFVAAMDSLYATPLLTLNTALSGFLLGSAVGILAGGVLADRIGARTSTAVATLLVGGGLIFLIGVIELPLAALIAVMTLAGFLQGFLLPTRDLMIRAVTPDGSMGKVMGFLTSGLMLAGGVTPLLYGWILDVADPNWVFWISAAFVAGALVSFATVGGGRSRA